MKKILLVIVTVLLLRSLTVAQYKIEQVTGLGKLSAMHMIYDSPSKEWILSNGYYVFKAWDNFNQAKLLFNSYPYFQYSLERFPNKNLFSRHFDPKGVSLGYENRSKYIDSSAVYVLGDSLKKINKYNPFSHFKIARKETGAEVLLWAENDCFFWGKDSAIICNNGAIGIEQKINGKDSLQLVFSKQPITAVGMTKDGSIAVAGTRDSGFYFIQTNDVYNYIKLPGIAEKSAITNFYFDESRKRLWVEEGEKWVKGFIVLTVYDYSNGTPRLLKSFDGDAFGLTKYDDVIFSFDFFNNQIYLKTGLKNILIFDVEKESIVYDFFWQIHGLNLDRIHQLLYNQADTTLYFSAAVYDSTFSNPQNNLYKITKPVQLYVQQVIPQGTKDKNKFFAEGIQTVVNTMPSGLIRSAASISENDIAIFSKDKHEYLLYNVRNGNMILAFSSVNVDVKNYNRIAQENTVSISPKGKYIFEWMVKAGVTSGIADTLQMALINLENGKIVNNKIVLLGGNKDESIESFSWDEFDRPTFVKKYSGIYPEKIIETLYFDSLLALHSENKHVFISDEVLYKAWRIPGSTAYLLRTGTLRGKKSEHLVLAKNGEAIKTLITAEDFEEVYINASGICITEKQTDITLAHWFDHSGQKINSTPIPDSISIHQLSNKKAILYARQAKSDKTVQIDLIKGSFKVLHSNSKTGFNYVVGPNDDLIVSASEDIQTWQIQQDSLYKLYSIKTESDFINNTQFTNNYLVSDGRVWNLKTGMLLFADLDKKVVLDDSTYLATINSNDIIARTGWFASATEKYSLKPHRKIFSKSLQNAKNLDKWSDVFKGYLLATKKINTDIIEDVYELPFQDDFMDNLDFYELKSQQSVVVIKTIFKAFDNDITTSPKDSLVVLNLADGKCSTPLVGKIMAKKMLKDGSFIVYVLQQNTKMLQPYVIDKGQVKKLNYNVKLSYDNYPSFEIANQNTIIYFKNGELVYHQLQTDKKEIVRFNYISANYYLNSSKWYDEAEQTLFIAYDDGGVIKIKDGKVQEAVKALPPGYRIEIVGNQGKFLLLLDKKGNYYMVNKQTLVADLSLFTWKGNSFSDRKYLWLTKDNYYMASPGVEKNIHFTNKTSIIPLKQGDLEYNRPDKVLEYLGAPAADIEFYRQLHQIRLSKYKAATQNNFSVKNNTIQLQTQVSLSQKSLALTVQAKAENPLSTIQVVVNGCPETFNLSNKDYAVQQTINIPLNAGENIIYTWVEDSKGNRSNFDERKLIGEFADSGKWYFVGIGVSQYKDAAQNLKYADKDISDIAKFLMNKYPDIIIDTLLNNKVTKDNINQLKKRLMQTNTDDKVIISFSGHGLLDDQKKFWFATHDVDFANPAAQGFAMASITGLLDKIPARYRMITLDACHSGDEVSGFSSSTTPIVFQQPIEKQSGIKGSKLIGKGATNSSSSALLKSMQMIFTDQLSNTGINLIAASAGAEFALEGEQWNNGVFTYALINGWGYDAGKSGSSYNRYIHYRDLKQYLQRTVSVITNGRQTPNTVMENGEINWWLVPDPYERNKY